MSNKAIVFYTGELLEVQENSLREAHGVENIIFVPIETVDDLNTKILETTEQPFTVYNYLTDPDLIIAVCDKLSNLTAETGFLPEYFIWVDGTELNSIQAHYNKPGELHVDVSGIPMPDSIKAIKERVEKFKEMHSHTDIRTSMKDFDPNEPRPDPYLSYGEAIEMCKKGIDVACVNWRSDEFLTVNTGAIVHADNFWSPGNKRLAMSKPDKSLSVFPHFLRSSPFGTVPYVPDFNDMFSEWVVASDRVKVKSAKIVKEDLYERLVLDFGLDTHSTADFELAPFWIVYDVLVKNPFSVTVISGTDQTNLPQIIGAIKSTYDQRQNITRHAWMLNESGYINGHPMPEAHIYHYVLHNVNSTVERILKGEFSCVIVDVDSFSSHLELSTVKHALKEAGTEWVAVSIKDQLQS